MLESKTFSHSPTESEVPFTIKPTKQNILLDDAINAIQEDIGYRGIHGKARNENRARKDNLKVETAGCDGIDPLPCRNKQQNRRDIVLRYGGYFLAPGHALFYWACLKGTLPLHLE